MIEVRLKVDKKMVIHVGFLFDKTAQYKAKLFWCSGNPQCLFYFDEFKFANVVSRAWKRRQDHLFE